MYVLRLVPLVLLFLETVCCQEDQVTNTNLDIVFLLDQQRTKLTLRGYDLEPELCRYDVVANPFCYHVFDFFENSSNYQMAYDGVQSFFDKDVLSDAKFAVIFSCNYTGGLMHDFNDRDFEKMIPRLLEDGKNSLKTVCGKNFAWMMDLANNKVFNASHGHRPSAAAIAIVLSDCGSPSEIKNAMAEFNYFFHTIKGHVYFVCYVEFEGRFRDYFKAESSKFMHETLVLLSTNHQSNRSMIYLDGNNVNVSQRLEQLMPKRSRSPVASANCNQTSMCGICSGNGTCFAHCNWTTHRPTGNGTNCTELAPYFQRCKCPTPTTSIIPQPPSYWYIVLGFGILLLVLVGVVIGVCCIRAKKSLEKRTENNANAVALQKAPEKKAVIAGDLPSEQSTTNTMGEGSKVKSVSMKESIVKSMSKRSSVVKSLAKTGSVSKPADESGKSISKPKAEESKSLKPKPA